MKIKYLLVIIVICFSAESYAQDNNSKMYQAAYNYLNDSIIKVDYGNVNMLAKFCNECCFKGAKLKFDSELQVAHKFIENNRGFPISDFVNKKYKFSGDCLRAIRIGTGECELANQVQDSLKTFWEGYEINVGSEIFGSVRGLTSIRKDGYQVFFSDIYKNTLAAEVKGFCTPYDKGSWQGSSTSYFFVFNDDGIIEEIYSGVMIHYN